MTHKRDVARRQRKRDGIQLPEYRQPGFLKPSTRVAHEEAVEAMLAKRQIAALWAAGLMKKDSEEKGLDG